jgi:CBS-domain-containing membrane protein
LFVCYSAYDPDYDFFFISSKAELQSLWSEFFQESKFKESRIGSMLTASITGSKGAKFISHPAYIGNSSLDVLEQMARLGSHRVPVLTDSGRVHGLVTQSMFISLFTQQIHRLGRLLDMTVNEMVPYLASSAWQVQEDSLAVNAFRLMAEHNISGLGVVNRQGSLVGTISTSDLCNMGCKAEHFERLWYPVSLFIRGAQSSRVTTVMLLDTLDTVIRKMHDGDVHLVFVVCKGTDDSSVPLHVITQRDVLRFLCKHMRVGTM